MTKRQLSRVISLYRDGVSPEVCTSNIIEMSRSNTEAGIFVTKFFKEVWVKDLNDEVISLRQKICDLKGGIRSGEYAIYDNSKEEIKQLKEIIRGYQYEQSLDRAKPTIVADQRRDES